MIASSGVSRLRWAHGWKAETNASGVYVVSPLPVGDYKLEARKEGFKALTRERIRIDVNAAPLQQSNQNDDHENGKDHCDNHVPSLQCRFRVGCRRPDV